MPLLNCTIMETYVQREDNDKEKIDLSSCLKKKHAQVGLHLDAIKSILYIYKNQTYIFTTVNNTITKIITVKNGQ